jgi:hypothetical protein
MNDASNEHCFSQPHWQVIARGFNTETWFKENSAAGTGGILLPKEVHLRPGNYYYRFASSNSSNSAKRGGGWWIDFENFKKIDSFARSNQYSIRDAARLMLALPYDWTRVDCLVRAMLVKPLKAYSGEGKPAQGSKDGYDNNTTWIPTQHLKVCQLYIPGLFIRGTKPREQLYESVFSQVSVTSLL